MRDVQKEGGESRLYLSNSRRDAVREQFPTYSPAFKNGSEAEGIMRGADFVGHQESFQMPRGGGTRRFFEMHRPGSSDDRFEIEVTGVDPEKTSEKLLEELENRVQRGGLTVVIHQKRTPFDE